MAKAFAVSFYALGQDERCSDLSDFFNTREEAEAVGQAYLARHKASPLGWANRFTVCEIDTDDFQDEDTSHERDTFVPPPVRR